jgi:hypothetical protein
VNPSGDFSEGDSLSPFRKVVSFDWVGIPLERLSVHPSEDFSEEDSLQYTLDGR